MAKFIKKPVAIEALEWTGKNQARMFEFLEGHNHQATTGKNFRIDFDNAGSCQVGALIIKTLEGEHIATIGDYIIKGVKGEFYPCKPDIFKMTYFTEKEYAEYSC